MNGNDRVKRGGEVLVFAVLALGLFIECVGFGAFSFLASSVVSPALALQRNRVRKKCELSKYLL
jgi:hypothetical protein